MHTGDDRVFRPRVVVGTVRVDGGDIELMGPYSLHTIISARSEVIERQADLVWAVLAQCTGHVTVGTVIATVAKMFPEVDRDLIRDVIDDLVAAGAILDGPEQWPAFHALTINPLPYPRELSRAAVAAYTRSPRLAVAAGRERFAVARQATPLAELQDRRRSCRRFTPQPLGLDALGHVLSCGYRILRDATASAGALGPLKSATASAGGLYPLKIYVILQRGCEQLRAGCYEYDPEASADELPLVRLDAELDERLLQYAFDSADTLPYEAPAVIVIAADLERHAGKYGDRGYRFTIIESGMALQNMTLAATEMGLATLPYGGFLDDTLADELQMNEGLDSLRVRPLITLALGHPDASDDGSGLALVEELEADLIGRGAPIGRVGVVAGRVPGQQGAVLYGTGAEVRTVLGGRLTMHAAGGATSSRSSTLKALAEGWERYVSGVARVSVRASAVELAAAGCGWLDPRVIAPLTPEQYAALPLQPFDERMTIEWVAGYHAVSGRPVWVPIDLVYYPLSKEQLGRRRIARATSSGVAAYTSEQGAIDRGLLELLERDALMRNWFSQQSPKRVPIDLLPYHWRRRAARWRREGRQIEVLDLSANGAVIIEVIAAADTNPCFVSGAAASTSSFEEALSKAFQEVELALDARIRHPYQRRINPVRVRSVRDHARLYSFPDHVLTLRYLWAGEQLDHVPQPTRSTREILDELDPVVVRLSPLTPDELATLLVDVVPPRTRELLHRGPLSVVRVISDRLIPINFGYGNTHHSHATLVGDVAPQSLRIPQCFALSARALVHASADVNAHQHATTSDAAYWRATSCSSAPRLARVFRWRWAPFERAQRQRHANSHHQSVSIAQVLHFSPYSCAHNCSSLRSTAAREEVRRFR
jgi:thiazole/oxazole-forming peptide maturase SagD family component